MVISLSACATNESKTYDAYRECQRVNMIPKPDGEGMIPDPSACIAENKAWNEAVDSAEAAKERRSQCPAGYTPYHHRGEVTCMDRRDVNEMIRRL